MSTETASPETAAAETQQPAWFEGAFEKPGYFKADWHKGAPDPKLYEPYASAKTFDEFAALAHQRVSDAQRALRAKQDAAAGLPVKPEGDAATPEAMAEYRKARGLPTDAKEYGLSRPENFPEALWNQADAEAFQAFALEKELSPALVKEIAGWQHERAGAAYTAHLAAVEAQKAELARIEADYMQGQREALAQMWGPRVDSHLKQIAKLAEISGLPADSFDPTNSKTWIGVDLVKAFHSLTKMIPGTGDPTRREMGAADGSKVRDRSYWAKLDPASDDYKAWTTPSHPRHAEVNRERALAYQIDAEQRGAA